jgi:hypothetical protein
VTQLTEKLRTGAYFGATGERRLGQSLKLGNRFVEIFLYLFFLILQLVHQFTTNAEKIYSYTVKNN